MDARILIIEDEPAIADNITYALETDGFEPTWCATGGEGLEAFEAARPDLVVLDVGLPDADGFDICREIRRSSDTPIIFLTARKDEIDRVVGLEIGADDYVVKPFSPRELTARVKAVLRRTRNGRDKSAESADSDAAPAFQVDPHRVAIHYRGEKLDLSRYEYRILEILIDQPGWVFSREKLMRMAWDEPEASLERTVDAHIKTIRSKLRVVDPNVDPIQTHRGLGYSLREDL
jgi:two-component system catabolic regulation response regulator CreB